MAGSLIAFAAEHELRHEISNYAKRETDGNFSMAARQLLRDGLAYQALRRQVQERTGLDLRAGGRRAFRAFLRVVVGVEPEPDDHGASP